MFANKIVLCDVISGNVFFASESHRVNDLKVFERKNVCN